MNLNYFTTDNFYSSLQKFFADLNIPVNTFSEHPTTAKEQLEKTYKPDNPAHQIMEDIYFLGMVNDSAFKENKSSAKLTDIKSDYDGILIFGVELSSKTPTRSQIAEITRSFNREYYYTPVVVIFKYDTHISFANCERLQYKQKWREGEKAGKVALLKDINVESTHTGYLKILQNLSIKRTGKGSVNSYEELYKYWQTVFSVSILSKSFYRELANWYFWTLKSVEFPADTEPNREVRNPINVIRLITRLMFIWFIKEKGLVNENLFDEAELKKILNFNDKNSSVYYKAVLQNLFFATLNQEMGKREFRKDGQHYNVTNLYRYRSCFKNPDQTLSLFENIPFLNGGLFECLDKPDETQKGPQGGNKIIRVDGFSDHKDNVLKVPDFLFFGEEREVDLSGDYEDKKKRKEKVKGLIHILNSYKFTIAENTPVEEEIALDPELLGKVFENLLASYNPETQTTARKQTGSFYTPREIVTYMVDESLIAYLKNEFKQVYSEIDENELDKNLHILLNYSTTQPFSNSKDKELIIKAIDGIQILDPACGSGAFPMGALHQMVHVLNKLDPDNSYWRELQKQKAIKETEEAYQIGEKEERRHRLFEIDDTFENNASDYGRKLYLIENCIYGVDIQPIATQIAKLRFFISLIVDQKINEKNENMGITPLPNLETKFVAGNTLISLDETRKKETERFESNEIKDLKIQLANVRHKHFNAKTQKTKNKWRTKDKALREEIAEILMTDGWGNKCAEQLANWDPYDQNHFAGFFDSQWMYGIADDFDIVIGNPPYVQIQKFSGKQEQKDWANENYKTFARTGDIYSLFYERGNMLLKKGGVLAFITSNKWMRANYGKTTRKYFLEGMSILQLIDFGDSQIFENATTYTNILIFCKGQAATQVQAWDLSKEYRSDKTLESMLQDNALCENIFNEDSFVIIPAEQAIIKKRIEEIGTSLKEWDVSINYGVKTGFNEAFILTGEKKNELIAKDPKSAEIIKPVLRGRDIKRYKAEFADLWLVSTFPSLDLNINDYPALKEYLEQFHPKIKQTGETYFNKHEQKQKTRKKTGNKWFETQDQISYFQEFWKEKIVYAEIVFDSAFHYDVTGKYPEATAFIMTGKNTKYLTALLNSKFITYAFKTFYAGGDLRGNTFRYKKVFLNNLPIPKISTEKQLPFEILVDMILFAKEKGMESEAGRIDSVINSMVFDLYFKEEMKEKDCYITGYITEKLKPFKPDDTDEFKKEYIYSFDSFCFKNEDVFRCLKFAHHLVKPVRIIYGVK